MMRVLVADDDVISLRFLQSALRQLNCATYGVASLTDALAIAASTEFDLLLLDRNMPGGGGVELLAAMRKRGVDAPAIATSAEMTGSTRAQLHAAGFTECIEKPITLAGLGEVLRPWLHVPALDDAAGLAAIGGNPQALRALRVMLADELSKLRAELAEDAIARDALLDRLHRLRASCGFCGAPRLAAAAIAFEEALRANASGTPDRRGNFVACITETLDALPA